MKTSRLILGTVQFGLPYGINNANGKPAKESVFDILHFAHDNGIRQLDSAPAYGDSQLLIGEFIEKTGKLFDVNTKFHKDDHHTIAQQLEQALSQLKIRQVNTYFYHRFEDFTNAPETLTELKMLKEEGKIINIGVSIYTNDEFEKAISIEAIDVIQLPFNLLDNASKRGTLMLRAKKEGKELQVRSVFLQGLFFKESGLSEALQPLSKYLDLLKNIAQSHHTSMFNLALGYAFAKQAVDGIIIGVDTKEQLTRNLESANHTLAHAIVTQIDQIAVKEEALLYPYNWK